MSEPTQLCSQTVLQGLVATVADAEGAIAMSQLDMALTRWPTDARLHFLRASLLAEAQRFDEAVTAFAAALAHDPELHIARFQLGLLLLSSNHTEAALRVWAPLDTLDPTDPLLLFRRGLSALIGDRYAEAIDLLRQGINLNEAFPPLNRDIQGVIDRVTVLLAMPPATFDDARQMLLSGYLASKIRH